MPKQYFHVADGQRHGPFTGLQIKQRAMSGDILPHHQIQEDGSPKLYEARLVAGLFEPGTPRSEANPPATSGAPAATAVAQDGNGHKASSLKPRFRNPVSSLLNSLATIALDNMHARVGRGELSQPAFEQSAATLLIELQSAITFAEAMPEAPGAAARGSAPASSAQTAAPRHAVDAKQARSEPPAGKIPAPLPSGGRHGGEARSAPRSSPMASPPAAASPTGASGWQLGAAALAGGAWGYLLARQGGMGHGTAYGHGMGDTHVHYHGTASQFADASMSDTVPVDHAPVSHEQPQANVMGVDSNNDGLVDTFYGDSNGDGTADVMGRDTDADGDLDQIAIDRNHDGSFDQRFTEDSDLADADDTSLSPEADLEDQELEADDADYDTGDYDDIAEVGGDFGGDFDLG